MGYTNPWSVTVPAGTELANTIDDWLRRLRLDLEERLEDTIFVDMSADPIELIAGIGGNKTGLVQTIPFAAFVGNMYQSIDYDYRGYTFDRSQYFAPILLPAGAEITKAEMLLDRQSNVGMTWYIYSRAFEDNPAVQVQEKSVNHTDAGPVISSTGDISITIDPDKYYWIMTPLPATEDVKIYAARITYNLP